jgi:hypothetical protein
VISVDPTARASEEEDYREESASYQRLLAALVDNHQLAIEPDPVLRESDDGLLELQLSTL